MGSTTTALGLHPMCGKRTEPNLSQGNLTFKAILQRSSGYPRARNVYFYENLKLFFHAPKDLKNFSMENTANKKTNSSDQGNGHLVVKS